MPCSREKLPLESPLTLYSSSVMFRYRCLLYNQCWCYLLPINQPGRYKGVGVGGGPHHAMIRHCVYGSPAFSYRKLGKKFTFLLKQEINALLYHCYKSNCEMFISWHIKYNHDLCHYCAICLGNRTVLCLSHRVLTPPPPCTSSRRR